MPKKLILKVIIFVFIAYTGYWLFNNFSTVGPEQLQSFMLSFGIIAPLVFILLFTIRPFVLFPASIMAMAGGLSFGPIIGPAVTYIGSLAGAALSFFVMRKLGHKFRAKKWQGRGEAIQQNIEMNGFFYIAALRIIPVINFDFLSYLSALSRIKFSIYFKATMVGIIPGTFAFNFLGAAIVDLSPAMISITAGTFFIAFTIPIVIRKKMKQKNLDIDLLPDEQI